MKGKMYGLYNWNEDFEFSGNEFNKDYDDRGRLIFEGEYLNGLRHGKGK